MTKSSKHLKSSKYEKLNYKQILYFFVEEEGRGVTFAEKAVLLLINQASNTLYKEWERETYPTPNMPVSRTCFCGGMVNLDVMSGRSTKSGFGR